MTFSELLSQTLISSGGSVLSLEIQILIEKAFDISRAQFWSQKNDPVRDPMGIKRFRRWLKRLQNEEPLAYILGEKEFYGLSFLVNRSVLIPRPETEILVDHARQYTRPGCKILDIGSGSGCIAIALAKSAAAEVLAIEKSPAALKMLRKNIRRHEVQNLVKIKAGDLFPDREMTFDMIVSNPPYIARKEWLSLPISVRGFEPRIALSISGPTGLEILGAIISQAENHLKPGGRLFLEIGYRQQKAVEKLLRKEQLKDIHFIKDYQGIPRVASAEK